MNKVNKKTDYEIIQSDRVNLITQANILIGYLCHKSCVNNSVGFKTNGSHKLNGQEKNTYNAALKFLQKEFEIGATPFYRVEKVIDIKEG